MRQQKIIFLLLVVTLGLIIIFSTGVGYAVTTGDSLKIHDNVYVKPETSDFNVKFVGKPTHSGTGKAQIKITGKTSAQMDITGLNKEGDYVIATFKIRNDSRDIEAKLSKSVINTNNKYFKVTATLSSNKILQRSGEETLSIKVELIKTPIAKPEKTNICVTAVASPNYDR